MKYKIAYIVSTLRRAGPTNQLFGIIKYLDLDKFDPVIITLSPEPENSMIEQFQKLQIHVESLNLSRLKGFIKGKGLLKKILNKINPDLIHTQGIRPNILGNKLKGKYPHILSLRNYPYDDYPVKFGKIMGNYMANTHYKIIREEKYSTVCSESLSEIYREKHKLNLDYIQNGVNTEKFYPVSKKEKLVLRKKYNIPDEKIVFISVGSLVHLKCTDLTIKAFLNFNISDDSLLLIAGEGADRQKLEAIAGGAESIRFLGEITNVKDYLQLSDFFISVSYSEGLPNTVLEAMACKIPVILTGIMPHQEIAGPDYPYLIDVHNVGQLKDSMEKIVKDDYDSIGDELLQIVRTSFSAEIMSKKYQKLYLKIINE